MLRPSALLRSQDSNVSRKEKWPMYLLVIILIGLMLRVYLLGRFGLWFDEAINAYLAGHFKNVFFLGNKEYHGIFFVALVKGWMNVGSSDSFLRFLSVMLGIFSIFVIYYLGKLIFSEKVGILSALFLSISPLHIYYSQELTCYALSVFLALFSSYYFLKILRNPDRISSVLYVLSTACFIYTHPVNLIFVLTQNIFFCFFYYKDKNLRKRWIYLELIIFLLALPGLIIIITGFLGYSQSDAFQWIEKPNLMMLLQTFMVFSLGYYASWKLQLVALFLSLPILLKAISHRQKRYEILYLIAWLVVPISVIWLISQRHTFYIHRIFLFSLPAFYLLMAAGAVKMKRYLAVGIISFYLILVAYSLNNYYENKLPHDYKKRYLGMCSKKDYKKAAIYVAENFREGDVILHISCSSFAPFIYYHRSKFPEFGIKLNDICEINWLQMLENKYKNYSSSEWVLEIKNNNDLYKFKRVWLIYSFWDFQGTTYSLGYDWFGKKMIDFFDKNFPRKEERMFEGVDVCLFSIDREA